MDDLVPDYHTYDAKVHCVDLRGVEERRLKNSGGEVDRIGLRIFVSIHGWRCHAPKIAVGRLTSLRETPLDLEFRRAFDITKKIISLDLHRGIISPVVGIADLIHLRRQLGVCPLLR